MRVYDQKNRYLFKQPFTVAFIFVLHHILRLNTIYSVPDLNKIEDF